MQIISPQITQQLPFPGQFAVTPIYSLSAGILQELSKKEKQELEIFTNVKRQQEYISSRILLREMAREMGIDTNSVVILKDELGQPYGMTNDKRFNVSIAHTDELVFCGITTDTPIGVDLEPVDRKVPSKLESRISHPDEKQFLSKTKSIRLWTIKEAYIKLRGQGLRMNMNQVCIQRGNDNFFIEINNDKRAKICSFQYQGNWLAIAYYL